MMVSSSKTTPLRSRSSSSQSSLSSLRAAATTATAPLLPSRSRSSSSQPSLSSSSSSSSRTKLILQVFILGSACLVFLNIARLRIGGLSDYSDYYTGASYLASSSSSSSSSSSLASTRSGDDGTEEETTNTTATTTKTTTASSPSTGNDNDNIDGRGGDELPQQQQQPLEKQEQNLSTATTNNNDIAAVPADAATTTTPAKANVTAAAAAAAATVAAENTTMISTITTTFTNATTTTTTATTMNATVAVNATNTTTEEVKKMGPKCIPKCMKFQFFPKKQSEEENSDNSILKPYCSPTNPDEEWCIEPPPIRGRWVNRWGEEEKREQGGATNNVINSTAITTRRKTKNEHIVDICCSSNSHKDNSPKCNSKQLPKRYRDWKFPKPTIHVPFHTRDTINSCKCSEKYPDPYVWEWDDNNNNNDQQNRAKPTTTKAVTKDYFDPLKVCELLGNRTVYMIGDSQMKQVASTMSNALVPVDFEDNDGKKKGCRSQLTSGVVDTLINEKYGRMNRGGHFVDVIKKYKPDIVILGTGAHIKGEENYVRVVNETLRHVEELRTIYPQMKFVWKTLSPGGCTTGDELADLIHIPPDEFARRIKFGQYNWDYFYGRDLWTILKMKQHNIPVMDLRMLYSRTDYHIDNARDCLHLCSPGPLDVVPMIFQNLLEGGL